jgi:P4 family phage/plasmid primase-like protien
MIRDTSVPPAEELLSAPCEPLSADADEIVEPADEGASTVDMNVAPSPSGPYFPLRELLEGPPLPKAEWVDRFARWPGLMRGQGFAMRQVRQIFWQVGQRRCVPPLSAGEFEEFLGDAEGRCGVLGLRDPGCADPVLAPGVDPADADARCEALMQPESFPWNSLGNAKRFVHMFGGRVRYAQDEKCWLLWNGRFWQRDDQMVICRLYRQMVEAMFVVAALIPPGQTPGEERALSRKRKDFIAWIHKSQSWKVERDSIQQARAEAAISGCMEDFDRNEDLMTFANGTLDLKTGVLRPHDPADRITRYINIAYDPSADCPVFKAFLLAIQDNDAAMVDYLQLALGYSMTADVSEQCLFICKGDGANGKSTLLSVATAVLGEYASTTDRSLLVLSRRDHPASIHALRNIRLAVTSEAEQDEYLSESLIKQMTGEREIQARGMGQDFVRVPITWKLWLSTNYWPKIRGIDFGIRRRIRVIPFGVRFDGDRDDKALFNKMMAERAGILAWLVAGCLA